jgi:hypothetical protein
MKLFACIYLRTVRLIFYLEYFVDMSLLFTIFLSEKNGFQNIKKSIYSTQYILICYFQKKFINKEK